ncbi:predicted protein [Aspergillus nidulans FGSC A4]|uniref:Uncharacterized protein n=1 Tax=Emericella nidulans (strain FGSC A4 / ATCC 38163 / CBS 112.46 / NRRL 194 / M139) TaxID=227321 RepID=Q5BBI3_EMENI|nr:hypothetical protein [Aspergillus nidulans FGSC A4]EAA64929.1 predicted protein [Aspergillus nidulans FGSC A4]CBF86173.1 TPA: conserved hypothetical protein [Aspergillus nidulans FGSC A4]|eukprot:XP_659701.1 predicted protein [Aspergillus nidulans FGSC A4]
MNYGEKWQKNYLGLEPGISPLDLQRGDDDAGGGFSVLKEPFETRQIRHFAPGIPRPGYNCFSVYLWSHTVNSDHSNTVSNPSFLTPTIDNAAPGHRTARPAAWRSKWVCGVPPAAQDSRHQMAGTLHYSTGIIEPYSLLRAPSNSPCLACLASQEE